MSTIGVPHSAELVRRISRRKNKIDNTPTDFLSVGGFV